MMRGRSPVVASVTLLAFTTLVIWPRGASARQGKSGAVAPPAQAAPDVSAPATAAPAGDDATLQQAKQHFETGRNAYNAGDYLSAIREFKAAEALRPSPLLDYNIGLANEKLGKRRVAVKYYRRYLELQPNAANKGEVEQKVATLEAEIAQQPPPPATGTAGGEASPPNAQVEQPGDMPPPDPNASAAAAQPGYDPYASQPPPGQPAVAGKPPKKKSYWWVGLIIAGGVTITVVAIIIAVYAVGSSSSTVYYGNHALTSGSPDTGARIDRHDLGGVTLFRF